MTDTVFDPHTITDLSIPKMTAALGALTDEQLQQVFDAEAEGERRAGALDALEREAQARDIQETQVPIDAEGDHDFIIRLMDAGYGDVVDVPVDARDLRRNRFGRFAYAKELNLADLAAQIAVRRVELYRCDEGNDQPVAWNSLAVPLVGGAGRNAKFPAGTISFDRID